MGQNIFLLLLVLEVDVLQKKGLTCCLISEPLNLPICFKPACWPRNPNVTTTDSTETISEINLKDII